MIVTTKMNDYIDPHYYFAQKKISIQNTDSVMALVNIKDIKIIFS